MKCVQFVVEKPTDFITTFCPAKVRFQKIIIESISSNYVQKQWMTKMIPKDPPFTIDQQVNDMITS